MTVNYEHAEMKKLDEHSYELARKIVGNSTSMSVLDMFGLIRMIRETGDTSMFAGMFEKILITAKLSSPEMMDEITRIRQLANKAENAARKVKESRTKAAEEYLEIINKLRKHNDNIGIAKGTTMPYDITGNPNPIWESRFKTRPKHHIPVRDRILNFMDKIMTTGTDELADEEVMIMKYLNTKFDLKLRDNGFLMSNYVFSDRKKAVSVREAVVALDSPLL